MLEGREPLTVDSLKKMKVRLKMHLNGGDKFSARTEDNEDYGVCVTVETNGRPQYKVTSRVLFAPKVDIVVDLLAIDREKQMADFCEAYNTAYGLHKEESKSVEEN